MTHDWKPGDRAMVEIESDPNGRGMCRIASEDKLDHLHVKSLHPLPAPDEITTLERAVVEAMLAMPPVNSPTWSIAWRCLMDDANALRAARTPPAPVDPFTALRSAWKAPRGMMWAEGVQAALDAAEAAWKEKT